VRNVGESEYIDFALRRAIDAGKIPGPRMLCTGLMLSSTGGHGDLSGFSPYLRFQEISGVADGLDGVRKRVRENVKFGADWIKVAASAGVLSEEESVGAPQYSFEEMKVIVEEAAMWHRKVAAHAHGTEGMKRAVEAGVDSIEHGTYMSDEVMALMKARGTYYVPTVSAGRFVLEKARIPGYFPAVVVPKALAVGPVIQETLRRAYAAGVKIAFGTDQGVGPHGDNALEFGYMVEAGMPPLAAIRSATLEAATLLGLEKELGTVEPGKLADIVAVPGDLLADIRLATKVSFVMKGGTVHKQ